MTGYGPSYIRAQVHVSARFGSGHDGDPAHPSNAAAPLSTALGQLHTGSKLNSPTVAAIGEACRAPLNVSKPSPMASSLDSDL
jgi:hypothetical protein